MSDASTLHNCHCGLGCVVRGVFIEVCYLCENGVAMVMILSNSVVKRINRFRMSVMLRESVVSVEDGQSVSV